MVSVVIPVYNVEPYLNRCLESVVNQTYSDFEILLINDGSTDNSAGICRKWATKDNRITYYEKENEGLGPTRNLGIKLAVREYILFIDSDDWWELNAIEKLMECACKYDADIVFMSFFYSEHDEQGVLTEWPHYRWYSIEGVQSGKDLTDVIFDGDARMWSKLFRRRLFVDNDLYMPAHPYEDFPIMPLLVIYAERICQIDDVLYHYNFSRPNNIIGDPQNKKHIFTGLKELYDAFVTRGLHDYYKEPLREYIINMAKFALNELKGDRREYIEQLMRMYPDYPYNATEKVVVWGSYNSLIVARNAVLLNSQILNHYMFSSIISAMADSDPTIQPGIHKNNFRQNMINKDMMKLFTHNGCAELQEADYVIIDFLEEINDIINVNNSYFTNSEAHSEISMFSDTHDTIPIISDERKRLWEKSCLKFISYLKRNVRANRVILLRMPLCLKHGKCADLTNEFDNSHELSRINSELAGYYDFFEANFEGIKSINIEVDNLLFTYEYTRYGCLPQYYNGMKYRQIARQVSAIIEEGL
jgi:hypothetical protein